MHNHGRDVEPIRSSDEGTVIEILVVPNASRSEIVGLHGKRVKVRVAAPPDKGRANTAVISLMRDVFGVRVVTITAGRTHRQKTVELRGVDPEYVRNLVVNT